VTVINQIGVANVEFRILYQYAKRISIRKTSTNPQIKIPRSAPNTNREKISKALDSNSDARFLKTIRKGASNRCESTPTRIQDVSVLKFGVSWSADRTATIVEIGAVITKVRQLKKDEFEI
jgi:hypothetical protein